MCRWAYSQDELTDRKLVANRLFLLPIALCNCDSPVVVIVVKSVIRHVPHAAQTTTSVQQILERGLNTGPDLDACRVAGVGHGDVVDVQVLDNVGLPFVLAQRPDADPVRPSAVEVLHNDVGAIGLERDAVVRVNDDRVLDDDAIGTICIPAVRVGNLDSVGASGYEIHVADDHVRCVGDHVEPLLRPSFSYLLVHVEGPEQSLLVACNLHLVSCACAGWT